jgi:predicted phosphate transport protein (TIGR00153 family)
MLSKLMPRTDDFYSAFEAQAAAAIEGAKLLKALLEDFTDVPAKCQAIKDVEHRADDITHAAFSRLHKQFITPFDRGDIHRLLSRMDDVIDLTDAAAERLGLYDVEVVIPEARELAGILVLAAQKVEEAVKGLRDLKKNPGAVLKACEEVNALENQADALTRRTMAKLFRRGSDPLEVMKWKEIIDFIEDATDRAEDVANVIEGVVLEHA